MRTDVETMTEITYSNRFYDVIDELRRIFDMHIDRLTLDTFENGTVLMQITRDISWLNDMYNFESFDDIERRLINYHISVFYDDVLQHSNELLIDELRKTKRI